MQLTPTSPVLVQSADNEHVQEYAPPVVGLQQHHATVESHVTVPGHTLAPLQVRCTFTANATEVTTSTTPRNAATDRWFVRIGTSIMVSGLHPPARHVPHGLT